ncbi:MAG: hypothetical protein U5L06_06265 [Rhodovibrio sp.]|nr:hypothetical protein [Rhodovibrio sp.]
MYSGGTSELDVTDLERWFDGFAADHPGIEDALTGGADRRLLQTELRNASFLVRVKGDSFVFAHTSFYEYFLGLSLRDACLEGDLSAFAGPAAER